MSEKCCTKCKEIKPLHAFHKNKCRKDGLNSSCASCDLQIVKLRKFKQKECTDSRHLSGPLRFDQKRCSGCREIKTQCQFSTSVAQKDGFTNQCKSCINTGNKKRYDKNPEKVLATNKAWKVANPERVREANQLWRLNNLEHTKEVARVYRSKPEVKISSRLRTRAWNRDNRELCRFRVKQARILKPEMFAKYKHTRRALEAKAEGTFTEQEWLDLCSKYNKTCPCCLAYCDRFSLDHIVALKNKGTNWITNLQPLCLICNLKKWIHPWGRFPIPNVVVIQPIVFIY